LGQNVILFTIVSEAVLIAIASAGRVLLSQKKLLLLGFSGHQTHLAMALGT
tara:strand:- start:4431 stop:4583 length:153 start_codon:yes stop_codon:yes gene_type:complete